MPKRIYFLMLMLLVMLGFSCGGDLKLSEEDADSTAIGQDSSWYQVGFLIMEGVYNTELTAPFDVFQHTRFREGIKPMHTFLVAESREGVRSFEGIRLLPDYAMGDPDLPKIDILVVPSAEHHLDSDLDNKKMIDWVRKTAETALYVTSHCDGAFVLAKAGILEGSASTTFPADIDKYRKMFPMLDVRQDVLFVHDGKYITSAGGAKSFEAALYLVEHLYGAHIARDIAKGLVIDWDLNTVPHIALE